MSPPTVAFPALWLACSPLQRAHARIQPASSHSFCDVQRQPRPMAIIAFQKPGMTAIEPPACSATNRGCRSPGALEPRRHVHQHAPPRASLQQSNPREDRQLREPVCSVIHVTCGCAHGGMLLIVGLMRQSFQWNDEEQSVQHHTFTS